MISSKKDYKEYLREDRLALGINSGGIKTYIYELLHPVVRYQMLLRKTEYITNCFTSPVMWPIKQLYSYRLRKLGWKYGFTIPINVFGKGLSIAHVGTIIVNGGAHVGDYCRIHADVNIGTAAGKSSEAPILGNNIYIGPGVKLFGPITIADNIAIGANSVVNRSFEEESITIGGIPAKKISDKGSHGLLYTDN